MLVMHARYTAVNKGSLHVSLHAPRQTGAGIRNFRTLLWSAKLRGLALSGQCGTARKASGCKRTFSNRWAEGTGEPLWDFRVPMHEPCKETALIRHNNFCSPSTKWHIGRSRRREPVLPIRTCWIAEIWQCTGHFRIKDLKHRKSRKSLDTETDS